MDSGDTAELNKVFEELTRASHRLAEVMYQKTAGQAPPGGGAQGPGGPGGDAGKKKEEEVIDAEYVDVDDKSK